MQRPGGPEAFGWAEDERLSYYQPAAEAVYTGKEHSFRALCQSPTAGVRGIGGGLDWLRDEQRSPSTSIAAGVPTATLIDGQAQAMWQLEGNFPASRR
jgi:hypothetical protein